jgi:predicted nucleic acid-binding protein
MTATRRVGLDLDQRRAQAAYAASSEAIGADLLTGDRRDAARELLAQLDCAPLLGVSRVR